MLQFNRAANVHAQQEPPFTFKAGVDLVRVSAVAQDQRGRLVKGLSATDFEVFDDGARVDIEEFSFDLGGVTVALVFDISGSMEGRLGDAREAGTHILSWLNHPEDEAAVFSFDTRLDEIAPFAGALEELPASLSTLTPFGATSLHDAIAQTAERLDARTERRGAVIVFTDGNDNASRLTPSQVSGIASSINVPVYIFGIVPNIDNPSGGLASMSRTRISEWDALSDLAHWTGGKTVFVSSIAQRSIAAREVIDELRHQYFIGFEASAKPGWHPLVVRARDKNLQVRARSGYFAGLKSPMSH
jgi:VWFA-related protein